MSAGIESASAPSVRGTLGLDVGGANLKAAHSSGETGSRAFELWKRPADLADALRDLSAAMPAFDRLAVTMTGELCDCFESRRQGVLAILDAVEVAAAGSPIVVWTLSERFVSVSEARADPLQAAASNWLGLARFVCRCVPSGVGLLLDVGSTTTDIVGVANGRPVPAARADPERLRRRELVYTGVRRTPISAVLGLRSAAEFFATTLDANLVLGNIPENAFDRSTADGRPATRAFARARLARMLCGDAETVPEREIEALARQTVRLQARAIARAIRRTVSSLPRMPDVMIFSGAGEFLAAQATNMCPELAGVRRLSLSVQLGPARSIAAAAVAVAVLAEEASRG